MNILAIEGKIPVNIPGMGIPIEADIRSSIEDGITINIKPGAQMFGLHALISEGGLLSVNFDYKEYTNERH